MTDKVDLRHVIWTTEDGKWVRATSKVFSCYPEAYEYYHTMGPSRDRVIMPIGLETAIMAEGINRGIDLMHNTLMKSINSELG
jgi:hypothetical protein